MPALNTLHGRRVGLLGGSFNPAHEGHLHISAEALRRLALAEIWWLTSPQNPLKSPAGMAPLEERLARARLVARDARRIKVVELETALGSTHTADTLKALNRRFPRFRFVWLMGADNLVQISLWRNWASIFDTAPVAVFARSPYSSKALVGKAAHRFRRAQVRPALAGELADMPPPAWVFLPILPHPESATRVRKAEKKPGTGGKT